MRMEMEALEKVRRNSPPRMAGVTTTATAPTTATKKHLQEALQEGKKMERKRKTMKMGMIMRTMTTTTTMMMMRTTMEGRMRRKL